MKYQGIIFDLDGVICHTDNYHYRAWKALADELGIYFDEQINNRLRGVSRIWKSALHGCRNRIRITICSPSAMASSRLPA